MEALGKLRQQGSTRPPIAEGGKATGHAMRNARAMLGGEWKATDGKQQQDGKQRVGVLMISQVTVL
jgi:hypothetical protein